MPVMKVDFAELCSRDANIKLEDVKILQEWLKKQPHLPPLEDYQIVMFLHSCFYKIEFTKVTIDKYFTMKTHQCELFDYLSEDTLKKAFNSLFCGLLPKTTPKGHRILLIKLLDPNPELYNFSHLVTIITMVLTLYMYQKGFATGGICIFDVKGFCLAHVAKFHLNVLKHGLEHIQEGAPLRIKGLHFINMVPAMEKVKIMMKPFLKSDVYNIIEFHSSSLESLFPKVPQEYLPEDYGGGVPSIRTLHEENLQNLLDNYEYFRWHAAQKVDESRRIGESKGPFYGVSGTFKKIEID